MTTREEFEAARTRYISAKMDFVAAEAALKRAEKAYISKLVAEHRIVSSYGECIGDEFVCDPLPEYLRDIDSDIVFDLIRAEFYDNEGKWPAAKAMYAYDELTASKRALVDATLAAAPTSWPELTILIEQSRRFASAQQKILDLALRLDAKTLPKGGK